MQNKGIIMQIANGHAIVLTKNREFLKIPLLDGMSVGQEVDVPDIADIRKVSEKKRNWFMKTWKQTGAVAACLLLAVGFFGSQSLVGSDPKAYAYVSVDINPSIELSIDENHKVVDAKGLNQDGEQVLTDLKLQGVPVEEAISRLAEMAKSKGYLNEQTEVLITASLAGTADAGSELDQIENSLVAKVQQVTSTIGAAVDVEGIVVSQDVRKAAQEAGVSPGKYAFYLSAQSNGVDVDLNELKKESIHAIIDKQGTELADVIHNIRGGKDLDKLNDTYKNAGKDALQKQAQDATKATVQPKAGDKRQEEKQQPTPPGQSKKQDVQQQNNGQSNKNNQEQSNREQGSKNNGNGNSKENHSSNKQDDKGSRDDQNSNNSKEQGKNNSTDNNDSKKNDNDDSKKNDKNNGRDHDN
ncbi:MAG: anti-sigma factor domain-containing protein [Tumebacillaceae bacterium]